MRTDAATYAGFLSSITDLQRVQSQAMTELSSGKRVNAPSDDPSAAGQIVSVQSAESFDDTYTSTGSSVRARLSAADSALSSVVTSLTRATTLVTEGANGTESASDRAAIAQELSGIRDQVQSLGNSQFEGEYLFGGTNTTNPPFVADSTGTVTYQGASTVARVPVGESITLLNGVTGDKLFGADGRNVFDALSQAIASLNSGQSPQASASALQSSLAQLNEQRVSYGTGMNTIDNVSQMLASNKVQMQSREQVLSGADMTAAASELTQSQTAETAVMSAFAQVSKMSLFDFLK